MQHAERQYVVPAPQPCRVRPWRKENEERLNPNASSNLAAPLDRASSTVDRRGGPRHD